VFQFTSIAGLSAVPITRIDLLNLMMTALTATTAVSTIGAIKIKKIRVWSPIISSFVPQTVEIEWNGGLYAPSAIHSAVSEGLSPSKLETSPPLGSSPSLWSIIGATNSGETMFTVTCPSGSVLQLSVALRLMDDEAAGNIITCAGASIGKVYYGFLDAPPLTGSFQPSGGVAVIP
jgi:hypothetical protein